VAPLLVSELVEWMRGRQILLILDNVERLQDGGQSVARLLKECPRVRFLLASPLEVQLEGEQRVAIGPEPQPAEQSVETDEEPETGAAPTPNDVDGASGWCLQPGVAPDESKLLPLTTREREVAQLLALGLTNREIADELVITYRTAETHACRVLRKLGFSCRSLVVQWAIERGLVVVAASRQS
jgi:DNA-binding CsgD family transcriptional regulator